MLYGTLVNTTAANDGPKKPSKASLLLAASLPAIGMGQRAARLESLQTDVFEVQRLQTQLARGTLKPYEITDIRVRRIVCGDDGDVG